MSLCVHPYGVENVLNRKILNDSSEGGFLTGILSHAPSQASAPCIALEKTLYSLLEKLLWMSKVLRFMCCYWYLISMYVSTYEDIGLKCVYSTLCDLHLANNRTWFRWCIPSVMDLHSALLLVEWNQILINRSLNCEFVSIVYLW